MTRASDLTLRVLAWVLPHLAGRPVSVRPLVASGTGSSSLEAP